ncbi:hypothetical protein EDD36DRAFT_212273 [Exophiala viscosa]|uniref:Prion-inhibition and propagation HeLo domain-containing protein n=1 Tax=Exophiala viscosa TaxID=2486360 RepID=A0AAN6IE21_9EURO|nr:hypothetical protein EDD36DRAFT_212273 [Exophiala viscosa]
MITGIETAGLVLAILPLIVNQLDAYIQGIETLKGFKTKRYRRRIQDYSTRLGTQRVILLNTLELSLEGIVEYEEDVAKLVENPRESLWGVSLFQKKLARKLGRSHDVFIRTMTELSAATEELSTNLGFEVGDPLKISWGNRSIVEREVKKLKDIFSKSVYEDLLKDIEKAIQRSRLLSNNPTASKKSDGSIEYLGCCRNMRRQENTLLAFTTPLCGANTGIVHVETLTAYDFALSREH